MPVNLDRGSHHLERVQQAPLLKSPRRAHERPARVDSTSSQFGVSKGPMLGEQSGY